MRGIVPNIPAMTITSIGIKLSRFEKSKSMPTTFIAASASNTARGAISHPSSGTGGVRGLPVFSSIFFPSGLFSRQPQG